MTATPFTEVVADVFDVDADQVRDEETPGTLENWTSLRHMELVVTLEEVYGLSFSRTEIKSFTSIGQIRATLRGKGAPV